MSDVNANININFDTKQALQQLRQLQAGLSRFNQALTQGNLAAENAQKGLNAQLMQAINATGKFVASQKEISTSTRSFTDALEKNKFSMREYFRYTAAAATANTKTFSRMFAAEREVINRARKDRVKLLQSQYIQLTNANGELVKVLQVVPKHLEMVNGKYTDYATRVQMAAQRQQILNQLIKQGSTQLLNFGKNTQWAGRQLMVGLTIPLTMLGSTAARIFMEMEQAVLKFSRVYGDSFTSSSQTDQAVENIRRLGMEFTKYGVAVKDTMEMAASAAAMGLTGSALEEQVKAATKLSVLGQVEQQQALETTISLQNAFGISSDQLAQKINFLNAVENQTVLSIEDLTIAVPKAGPVIRQLGGSVEDLAFFMTAMKEGGINASEGANALKSGLASLINPSDKASEFLAELGINIKGIVEANAGNLKATVVGFAQALDTLDPLNRARAIEQLFGKFQFARLSTLFQNVTKDGSQASRAFKLAGASVEELAILSERELGKIEDAVGVKFKKSIETLKMELVPIGKAFLEAATPIVEFIGNVLKKFNSLSDGTKKAITIVTAVIGGIAPVALMTFGLVANGAANLIKFFGLLRAGVAKLNGANQVLGGGFDYLTQQEIENLAETNALHTSHQNLISTFNVEKGTLDALAAAYANATTQARALAASAPGLFNTSPGAAGAVGGLPPVKKYKDGVFSVPGTGSGDKVPAMLEPGETVVSKDNTKKYSGLLQAIATDSVPGYRKGKYDLGASQSDRLFASGTLSSGATQDYIVNELGRIRKLTDTELIAYAERTGKTITDTTKDTLESLRETIVAEFKSIVTESKSLLGEITEENISKIGKTPGASGTSRMGEYFPRFDQQQRAQFSHVGQTEAMSIADVKKFALTPDVQKSLDILSSLNLKNPNIRVADAFGMDIKGTINRGMASTGSAASYEKKFGAGSLVQDLITNFEETGTQKWKTMTDLVGKDFDSLSAEIQIYDDALLNKIKAWQTENATKPIPDLMTDDIFRTLEAEVRTEISGLIPEFSKVIEAAKNTITALRVSVTKEELQVANAALTGAGVKSLGPRSSSAKIENIEARTAGQVLGTKTIDGLNEGAGTQSPSKKSKKTGNDIGDGLIIGMKEKETEIMSQSERLASNATSKIDEANQAYYDSLRDSPEEFAKMKSIDRNRRNLAKQFKKPKADKIVRTTEKELEISLSATKSRRKSDKVVAEQSANQADIAEQTSDVMTDVRDTTQSSADTIQRTSGNLKTQDVINDAITSAEIDRGTVVQERLITEEQINAEKQKELEAARISAANAAANADMPPGSQVLPGEAGFIGPLTQSQQKAQDRIARKKMLAERRGLRAEKVAKFSGKASGALGVAAMGAGMLGAPAGVTAALGSASMVSSLAPMFAKMGPYGWAATALAATAIGAKVLNDKLTNAAKATAEFVKQTSATGELMKKISETTGMVGASEIMNRRRSGGLLNTYIATGRKGTTEGEQFMSGDVGKSMQESFAKSAAQSGTQVASQQFAIQLASAVSDGSMPAELAEAVAYQLGVNLKDSSISMQVDGYLRTLIGQQGEDLLKDPLAVRTRLANVAGIRSQQTVSKLQSGDTGQNSIWSQIGTLGLIGKASGSGLAAELAASSSNAVEMAQMQADAMAVYYEKEIQALETQKAATTNKQKQLELETKIKDLIDQQTKGMEQMNRMVAARITQGESNFRENVLSGTSNSWLDDAARREDAYFDAMKANIKGKYAGTAYEGSAQKALNTLARSDEDKSFGTGKERILAGRTFEAKMQIMMESGQLNPDQVNAVLDMYAGNLAEADAILNIASRTIGGQKTAELVSMFSGFKNKKEASTQVSALVRLSKKDPKKFDEVGNALAILKRSDGLEIDMEAYINTVGLPGLLLLSDKLNAIEKLETPLTKDVVIKFGKDNNVDLSGLLADWDTYYSKLPEEVRKEAIQTYTTLYDTFIHFENEDARRAWATKQAELEASMAGAKGSQEYETVYNTRFKYYTEGTLNDPKKAAEIANATTQDIHGSVETINAKVPPANKEGGGKGTNPLDFLDSLAMRIKNVRDGAFNATKPLESMLAAFTSKKAQKDASKMFTIFDGLQQRMIGMRVPKEFRDMIASMSSEDFTKLANLKGKKAIFKFKKGQPKTKANITGLTETGKAIMQTYREAQLGEFNVVQKETVRNVKDQKKAFNDLVASGMSASDALKVVEDTAVASAIAMGAAGKAGSAEMKQFVADTKAANDALEKQAVINDMINKNEEFKIVQQMPELAKAMKATGMSADQMAEVLNNPALAKYLIEDLKDGKVDAKEIADYLNSIEARKIIEIQTNFNKGDFAAAAAPGMELVDKMFSVQEQLLRTGADPRTTADVDKMNQNNKLIKEAEMEAQKYRRQIELINREISKMQREVEMNFNRPIEEAQEQISDFERELETNPLFGNRAIKKLQDESGMLSNDLQIIQHQADAINKKYDEQAQALQKVSDLNENISRQQQNQLDLANAITQGDIAAAARAAQQSRADNASMFQSSMSDALQQSRQNELSGLVGAESGLTQEQIQERQYEITQAIYQMENDPARLAIQQSILDLQDKIYNLEEGREAALLKIRDKEDEIYKIQVNQLQPLEDKIADLEYENTVIQARIDKLVSEITVLDNNRDAWERIRAKIEASTLEGENFDAKLGGLLASTAAIEAKWKSILALLASYSSASSAAGSSVVATGNKITEDGKKVSPIVTDTGAKTDSAAVASMKQQVATLTDLRSNVEKSSALGFKLKEQIDELNYNIANGTVATKTIVDEQTKMAGMRASLNAANNNSGGGSGGRFGFMALSSGGLVKPKYFAKGSFVRGTDTIPAMLTPGEFVMSRYAVNAYGLDKMKSMNNGDSIGESVYNYSINVNVKSDANPDDIARAVMTQIKHVDGQRLRGVRI